jgi:hypothetical protein
MKHYLLATAAAVCLSACAGTKVTNAVIATGSTMRQMVRQNGGRPVPSMGT